MDVFCLVAVLMENGYVDPLEEFVEWSAQPRTLFVKIRATPVIVLSAA